MLKIKEFNPDYFGLVGKSKPKKCVLTNKPIMLGSTTYQLGNGYFVQTNKRTITSEQIKTLLAMLPKVKKPTKPIKEESE